MVNRVEVLALPGIPEVKPGDDVARIILDTARSAGVSLDPGDVVVVKQKIVSKAEGRVVPLDSITPSPLAREIARRFDKDPRHVEAVLRESSRIVKMDQNLIISETRHGLICANAGVDASNVGLEEAVVLLPKTPTPPPAPSGLPSSPRPEANWPSSSPTASAGPGAGASSTSPSASPASFPSGITLAKRMTMDVN